MGEAVVDTEQGDRPLDARSGQAIGLWARVRLVGLAAIAAIVTINLWTGAPLLALWVGSRVAPASGTSMGAIVVVIVVLAATVTALAALLTRVNAAYDRLTGRDQGRRVAPWLRSMRAERKQFERNRRRLSAVERFAILSVVAALLALEVWFFLFAHYSLSG